MDRLRGRIERFLSALEEERLEVDRAQRRRPGVGALYEGAGDLFAAARITEVQRALAGSGGMEERRNRALLEFLARGRAMAVAADPLDQRLGWEVLGSVGVEESRIPVRQIEGALSVAADPGRRRAIEEAYCVALDEQGHLAEDFLARHRDGIGELGYGSHVEAYQVLGSIDLRAIGREGERFLADTEDAYRELMRYHLPRLTGVEPEEARAGDGVRLEAGAEYDPLLRGGEGHRAILEQIRSTGLDPLAEGRLTIVWEAYLGVSAGAVCHPVAVPDDVRVSVSPRSGRPAVASFLRAYGLALHRAYTAADLALEHRRLGDESVTLATGALFESLLRTPAFVVRAYGFPRAKLADYLGFAALCTLLQVRRDIGRLRYELAFYEEDAGPDEFTERMGEATGLHHDPRLAPWWVDGEFSSARRLRAVQLGATLALTLRNRFDEDWFRNPAAGEYLATHFQTGRRYSALEVAVQLSSEKLGFAALRSALFDG